MSLPYSSSTPALYPRKYITVFAYTIVPQHLIEKIQECVRAAGYLKNLLAKDIKPKFVDRQARRYSTHRDHI